MLRAAASLCGLLGLVGCLWEPVQLAPTPGNNDSAPVIVSAFPPTNDLFLSPSLGDPCYADVGLQKVYFPRDVPLQASFFLNFDATSNPAPLSIGGQTRFALQQSQTADHTYFLNTQQIRIADFLSQRGPHANVLLVFVSDDLDHCPNPSTVMNTADQNLLCTTTSWVWVIEPQGCPLL